MAMIATATSHGRDDHLDAVKGVCIIAVVAIHALKFDLFAADNGELQLAVAARQAINFPVAIFLGLAGYFAGLSQSSGSLGFIGARAMRILPAYLVACLVKDGAQLAEPLRFLGDLLDGSAITIGYFVIVLLQMTVRTPLIARIPSVRLHFVVIALGTAAGLAWTYGLNARPTPLAPFPHSALPFFAWYPLYHLGFLLARKRDDWNGGRLAAIAGLTAAAALIISIAEGYVFVAQGNVGLGASQLKAGSLAFASALLVAVLADGSLRLRGSFTTGLAGLGKTSYFIYLYHLSVLGLLLPQAIRSVPTKAGAILIAIAATVAICFAASRVIRAALGPETSSRVFGT